MQVRHTPLYHEHERLQAKIVDFHGWALPVQYSGILDEHEHTRRLTSLFDCSHMGEFLLRGREAIEHFDRLICVNVWNLREGRCRYGAILNDNGGIIDDAIMLRLGEDEFYVVTNAGAIDRISPLLCSGVSGAQDLSDATAKIDVQGPMAREVLLKAGMEAADELKYYQGKRTRWLDVNMVVTRAGYTGEMGYELFLPNGAAAQVWNTLLELDGVKPAGLGARNTLRLEVGYALSGDDFTEANTPLESGMERFIAWDKEFTGKAKLEAQRDRGGYPVLTGVRTHDRRKPQHGHELQREGVTVGAVTSGTFAPSLGYGVGLARVLPDAATAATALVMGPRSIPVEVVEPPFYTQGTCRQV